MYYSRPLQIIICCVFLCVGVFSVSQVDAVEFNDPFVSQWGFTDVGAYSAWDQATGSHNVVVAVVDNGFDTFHPDLRKNVWKNTKEIANNAIDDDNNGYIDDVWGWSFVERDLNNDGVISAFEKKGSNNPRPNPVGLTNHDIVKGTIHHGTVVAGLIGAVGNNAEGISGISPQVRLMNVQVVDESGYGNFEYLSEAIHYAVDNGADIINISMIGDADVDIDEAVEYAYNNNIPVVAAVGNDYADLNTHPRYPACVDADSAKEKIIGVSAIEESHRLARFSNIGSDCVDIAAPGVAMTSTIRFSPTNSLIEKYKGGWDGTSFAAPLVSGAMALIKAIQPTWGVDEIYTAVLSTVHRTPGQDDEIYSQLFGAGLLQVDKAVAYALERMVSRRTFSSVLFVSSRNGSTQESGEDSATIDTNSIVDGVDSVVSYREDGNQRYVTSKYKSNTKRSITLYSAEWEEISEFQIDASGALALAVGDVSGDGSIELVVSPKYADDQLFRVYEMSGEFIDQYSLSDVHNGASLAMTNNGAIVTFSEQKGTQVIDIFDHSFTSPTKSFIAKTLETHGSIAVGDIDGDRQDEVIVGGAVGERPLMSIYELDGTLRRSFTVFDGYTGGFSVDSADYNEDGKDDILTVPYTNSQPARVWTGKSKKIGEWNMFAGQTTRDIFAIIQ